MVLFEIGRVCVKSRGREAGVRCVVVDVVDKNFVLVSGLGEGVRVRRRRSNVDHLNPTELKLEIKKGASDEEVKDAYAKTAIPSKGEAEEAPAPSPPKKKRGKEKEEKPPKAKASKKTPARKEPPTTKEGEE